MSVNYGNIKDRGMNDTSAPTEEPGKSVGEGGVDTES